MSERVYRRRRQDTDSRTCSNISPSTLFISSTLGLHTKSLPRQRSSRRSSDQHSATALVS